MLPSPIMVKFFTQTCPRCLAQPSTLNDSKCLCIVKGHIVARRGYVDDKKSKEPESDIKKKEEKTNEQLFIENTKRALEMLKEESKKTTRKTPKPDE